MATETMAIVSVAMYPRLPHGQNKEVSKSGRLSSIHSSHCLHSIYLLPG
jgi:hypothetical protein